MKLKHWRGFPTKNGWKGAPLLVFYFLFLGWRRERTSGFQRGDLAVVAAQNVLQHVVGVLTQQGRTLDLGGRCRELDRHANVEPFAALRVVGLDRQYPTLSVLLGGEA